MSNLKITIFDVGHGTSIYVVAPNGKKALIDCGSDDSLSPSSEINWLKEQKKLDYLVISHPHQDHISDLPMVDKKFDVKVLRRNKSITKNLILKENDDAFSPPNDEYLDSYFSLIERFTKDLENDESPSNKKWGNGCAIHTFSASDNDLKINDRSVVSFIEFQNDVIFYAGDLEEKGWEKLLEKFSFKEFLKKTTIFIASHHGNESGYYKDIFDYFNPKLVIVSTGSSDNSSTISKYREKTSGGMDVTSKDGSKETRFVLTTRANGTIDMVFYPYDFMEPKIKINK